MGPLWGPVDYLDVAIDEDFLDDVRILDKRDDPHHPAAGRAGLEVDAKDQFPGAGFGRPAAARSNPRTARSGPRAGPLGRSLTANS